ncbi:SMC family ATPase [Nocardioides seonyuensis]|uniref:Nuclease SbcCD subunit C n=1 Tax=Nocardioides seonyuensis TaxID=2518371 RepID=A0A4P7IJT5_9ACTN|nr:SMC family ATPase [Nocardioides seonyuensis]QBX57043.1 SMC family ATPase [Nocardioides seonyuensis]
MRLHHLEVTAFGPFAATVRVDFDALSDAGLFLLSGPTGAGKSSVLDAVCFALYGDVPGDRATAKRLRCDQADEGVAPRVVLEATLSGRRFRVDRSPAWQRPKKRGTGITTEQARVTLSERVPGSEAQWRPLSTRLDETGHLITRLVGMNLPQFCQVALLPQGRFQAFLRAGSDERHALLQQVFQTGRFDQVEGWLRNRRIELRRLCEVHQGRVADQVSRISEVTSSPAPDDWEQFPQLLSAWSADLVADTGHRLASATEALRVAEDAETTARAEEEAGARLAQALTLLRETQERSDALDAAAEERASVRARVETARQAAALRPLHAAMLTAQEQAEVAWSALSESLRPLDGFEEAQLEDPAALDAIRHRTLARLADVDRLRPLAARVVELDIERIRVQDELQTLRARGAELDALARELPGRLQDLREQARSVTSSAARSGVLQEQVASLRERERAAQQVLELEAEAVAAETERLSAMTALQEAKEAWLGVRERRLEGMAAEIASSLVVGGCCPVCGSAEHPSPAAVEAGTPDVETERTARRVVDDLEVVLEARSQHTRDLATRLATARGAAGNDIEGLPALLAGAELALDEAEAHAAQVPHLTDEVSRHEAQLEQLTHDRESVSADLTITTAAIVRLDQERDTCANQVDDVLNGTGCDDLGDLTARLQETERVLSAAVQAHLHHSTAQTRLHQACADLERAAVEAGFASHQDALEAWLAPEELTRLETWAAEHDRQRHRVQEILADPALQAASSATPPDLVALEEASVSARQAAAAARSAHQALVERDRRLAALVAELQQVLDAWSPVRADHETTAALSAFVEGKSPDNRLQMRLSAYVLAHRLSQVVEAANLRLHSMSDQRYSLLHTGERGAGEKRGGLSLVVRDDWSGESRDPATLSGGETFVVSLALALGLADVITAEAGGADLDTLFVDEGFGSLDADTLDDVMDTLDSLRDGGRVVGVVSHVAEMQVRIPTQLRVTKARHGSLVSQ